jgi:hypothetical protein
VTSRNINERPAPSKDVNLFVYFEVICEILLLKNTGPIPLGKLQIKERYSWGRVSFFATEDRKQYHLVTNLVARPFDTRRMDIIANAAIFPVKNMTIPDSE